jgi:hypothetical protein
MKNITLTLLAAAAIGAVSIGSASAMPFDNVSAALGESHVQDVRVVCDQYRRCYNTGRAHRSARPAYYGERSYAAVPGYGYAAPGYGYAAPGYGYAAPGYGYAAPGYGYAAPDYGYYGGPRVGIGIGPFGFGVR